MEDMATELGSLQREGHLSQTNIELAGTAHAILLLWVLSTLLI
jgi:hypothetical protein